MTIKKHNNRLQIITSSIPISSSPYPWFVQLCRPSVCPWIPRCGPPGCDLWGGYHRAFPRPGPAPRWWAGSGWPPFWCWRRPGCSQGPRLPLPTPLRSRCSLPVHEIYHNMHIESRAFPLWEGPQTRKSYGGMWHWVMLLLIITNLIKIRLVNPLLYDTLYLYTRMAY